MLLAVALTHLADPENAKVAYTQALHLVIIWNNYAKKIVLQFPFSIYENELFLVWKNSKCFSLITLCVFAEENFQKSMQLSLGMLLLLLCCWFILQDIKDPAIPLNYAVYLFNQKQSENAIKQMQNFEIRVQKLRQMPGLDADPDVSFLN